MIHGRTRLPSGWNGDGKVLGMPRPERSPSPLPLEQAAIIETHISTLFFVGDRVFKLHKPVRFGFLDFREREERRADCEREVMLNRRLAPDVYLGVADVVLDGLPLDHMVVMKRLPEGCRLSAIASRGEELTGWLLALAEALVSFHQSAARSPEISHAATVEALREDWEANFIETDRFVGTVLDDSDEVEIRVTDDLAECTLADVAGGPLGHAVTWPAHVAGSARVLRSRNSSMLAAPISRPNPDCL